MINQSPKRSRSQFSTPPPVLPPALPPAVILIGTQLGENIGMAARAMHNFGLADLRLVAPRPGWSQAKAIAAAAGGADVLAAARIYPTLEQASKNLNYLIAATARPRDMNKEIMPPQEAIAEIAAHPASGIIFGPERSGLDNAAIALCDAITFIPANPAFSSLNLAQAVLILAFHWFAAAQAQGGEVERTTPFRQGAVLAKKSELVGLFNHLETELEAAGFFHPVAKRAIMVRNIRNIFHRARLSDAEIRALRGIIAALVYKKK